MKNSAKITLWQFGLLLAIFYAAVSNGQVANTEPALGSNPEALSQEDTGAIILKPEDKTILDRSAEKKDGKEEASAKAKPLLPVGQTAGQPSQMFGVHAALGVPHPMSFGLDFLTETKIFEVSLNFGAAGATVSGVTLSLTNNEVGLLYHPFATAFFVGALIGQQNLKAKSTSTVLGFNNVTAEANVRSNYITPHLGWHSVWNSGFSLGFEVGYQSPTSSQTDLSSNAASLGLDTTNAAYVAFEKDVKDQGDRFGKQGLPYITLLRVGWMF